MPRAAVSRDDGRKSVLLRVVPFGKDAPLHRATVHRSGGGECFRITPTARTMVNNNVLAVGNAERLASDIAGVLAGAKTQIAEDHVVCPRDVECVGVARAFLDANSIAGSRLASDCEVRFADIEAGRFEDAAHSENHCARALCLDSFSQASG